MIGQTVMELLPMALALIAAGGIAGFLAGLLGVGGGIVIVPVLFNLLPLMQVREELLMHIAVATSLATIVATSMSSVRAHYQRGAIDMDLAKRLAPFIVAGAALGAAAGGRISSDFLAGLFAVIALLVAIKIAFTSDSKIVTTSLPTGAAGGAIGISIGTVSVLMGIGGGTLGVPVLTSCNVPIRRAVATASTFGFLIAIPGVIGFVLAGWNEPGLPLGNIGYVNLIGVILLVPMTTFVAPFGAKVAHSIPPAYLRYAFAGFLTLTSLRMGYSLFT